MIEIKHRRGDAHPDNPGLFYWGKSGKGSRGPIWISAGNLAKYRKNQARLVAAWQKKSPAKRKECDRRMRLKRKAVNAAQNKAWKIANPERWKLLKYRHNIKRLRTDPTFRIVCRMRGRVREAFRATGWKKKSKTFKMLGCTPDQFRAHIESLFKPGMSWACMSRIHIDHRIPLASAKTKRALIALFHYTNLQPLWHYENQAKGSKMPEKVSP